VIAMKDRFHLGPQHKVVEVASNDGYLLQYFVAGDVLSSYRAAGNVAEVAIARGVPTEVMFFVETLQDAGGSRTSGGSYGGE